MRSAFTVAAARLAAAVVMSTTLLAACASSKPAAPSTTTPANAPASSSAAARPAPAPSPAAPYGTPEQLAAWVDGYVSAIGKDEGESARFSGYVAVARDGVLVFGKGYGYADKSRGTIADADTRFRLGSLTKQFTAVALMQLAQDGKLRLDAPVGDFVTGLSKAVGAVTLHQLATHTSGIANYTADGALMRDRSLPRSPAEVIATFNDKPLAFTPGAKFDYSNSNFFLLGLVLEKVSGLSYEAYLQARVLGPAGMSRTSTVDAPDAPNTAVGYASAGAGALRPASPIDMSIPFAAGALRSTPRDLIAWDRALTGEKLLSAASKARLFTAEKDGYAYGVNVETKHGVEIHDHGGGIDGFSTYFARVPSLGLAVIALGNNESFHASDAGEAIVTMAVKGERVAPPVAVKTTPLDPALVARLVGEYTLTDSARSALTGKLSAAALASIAGLTLSREGDRLFAKPSGQSAFELFRDDAGGLFAKVAGIRVAVTADGVAILQAGLTIPYARVKTPPPPVKPKTKAITK